MLDIEEGARVHWAQAECYAFLLAKERQLDHIGVQLTYIQIETEKTKTFLRKYSLNELENIVHETLVSYTPLALVLLHNQSRRQQSIQNLSFPYPAFRKGQKKLAGAVYKTIEESKTLFANAPTGTGKTISTLFPTIKGIVDEPERKWFYVTAKTITRTVAEETLSLLEKQGLSHSAVTLTAKDKICFKEETICQKEYCEFANGYYDRINGALIDILKNEMSMTRPIIESYAKKHRVCPFEFSIDLTYLVDGVICDYNYVFDPKVSLQRMKEEKKKKTALLIDEAHNLVSRGREMYSAELKKSSFLEVKRLHGDNEHIKKSTNSVNKYFLQLKKEVENRCEARTELDKQLVEEIEGFVEIAEKCLGEDGKEWSEEFLQLYFDALSFMRISKIYSQEHRFVIDHSSKDVEIKLFCIDPSKVIRNVTKSFQSTVFFSATLHPFSYFFKQLGGREEDYRFLIPSPFQKEQWDVGVLPISTRFKDRDRTLPMIVDSIEAAIKKYGGNFLVFFSSYSYMREAFERIDSSSIDATFLIQEQGMREDEREAFLSQFHGNREKPVIGFAVLGGIFSEGIDLKGDRLTGVIIVGVGLPQPSNEQELIKEYFNAQGMNGFDYAYVYPGLNKVFQSGGRLIRSEEDRGVLLLIDDRYLTPKYQGLMLEEWK
ncbi:ATP-dependent DNA helicase [Rossellomorea aquimaris]|uniref:ATP-dependent DNA helicase n=1 Tax=Rossellomorea aquimaris TaxID=189382 RepID=UPI000ACBA409